MSVAFVWVGEFASEQEFMDYANHSKRKCPFREDFPFSEYRGESLVQTFRSPKESLRDAMIRLYYAPGYMDAALAKLDELQLTNAVNAVKVIYTASRQKTDNALVDQWPKSGKPLRFIGGFEFDSEKTPLRHPEYKGIPAFEQEGFVSIWIGNAPSQPAIEEYMAEDEYDDEADEDRPASKFGRDWKLNYDHDYLFHEGYATAKPVKALLEGWADAKSFATEAEAAARSLGISAGNFIVVAYDLDYSQKAPFYTLDSAGYWRHKGKPSAKSPLKFVGAFRYEKG